MDVGVVGVSEGAGQDRKVFLVRWTLWKVFRSIWSVLDTPLCEVILVRLVLHLGDFADFV